MGRRRRRKAASSGIGDVVGLLIVASLFMMSFILKSAITLVIYGAPVVLLAGLLINAGTKRNPPARPNLADFDPKPEYDRVEALILKSNKTMDLIQRIYENGQSEGIEFRNWSDGDGPRFREHSKRGKALNRGLDKNEGALNSYIEEIRSIKYRVAENIPEWRDPFEEWRRAAAQQSGFKIGTLIYIASIAVLVPFTGDLSRSTESVVFLKILPTPLYAPAAAAPVVATLAFLLARMRVFQKSGKLVDQTFVKNWELLKAKWDPEVEVIADFESFGAFDDDNEPEADQDDRDEEVEDRKIRPRPWNVVLGVPEDASVIQIKTAWREGMKQYHPDRVAGLGPKLQALAEAETKELNAAYQIGIKLRG